jgi:hypothetical protein
VTIVVATQGTEQGPRAHRCDESFALMRSSYGCEKSKAIDAVPKGLDA